MSDWKEYKLGEILIDNGYIRGPFGSSLKRDEMKETGIPVYEQKNAIYNNRDFRFFIDEEKFLELKRFQVQTNDLIISCSGTVGKISIIRENDPKGIISQALLILRPNVNNVILKYLYFFLSSAQGFDLLTQASHGSVQVNIAERKVVENIPISLPNIVEQKAIAGLLSSLDDKIDLLHNQNKTLEAMAETLFRQWFVEELDEKWEEKKLVEIVDIGIGRTPPRREPEWFTTNQEDIKWISIKDMAESGVFILSTAEFLTPQAVSKFNIPVIPNNTIILSFKMTVGRVAITTEKMLSNEAIAHFKFRSETPVTKEYLYLFLKTYKYDSLGTTSTIVTSINSAMIKEICIRIPYKNIMLEFQKLTESLFNKIYKNQIQIRTLVQLRDLLLPKLMTGQVRINL